MPEGDTIFRTAATLRRWLQGRRITGARTTALAPVQRLVGETVEDVEARAKHLLIRCSGNLTLHTHMKMKGAWHVYAAGERWRRPASRARVVLECDDRVAVGFDVPVVEVVERRAEHLLPSLAGLGPDVLRPPIDLDEVRRRAAECEPDVPIADVLLDQGVVSGIGNIWRSETLFAERVDPRTPVGDVPGDVLDSLVLTAARLLGESAGTVPHGSGIVPPPDGPAGAGLGASPDRRRPFAVYRRAHQPCRRCGTAIETARLAGGRSVYWCPSCQPKPL